jgi:DNA polymerase (family 10)
MSTSNIEIARMLRELSLRLEMNDVQFKPRALEKASFAVEAAEKPMQEIYQSEGLKGLQTVPCVGKGIAERIEEHLRTGHVRELDDLRKETPVDILGLTSMESIGTKTVKHLYEQLGIKTVDDLEAAAQAGKIQKLPHFGRTSEARILSSLKFYRQSAGRVPLGQVLDATDSIVQALKKLHSVKSVAVAGSVRRRKDTIGDLDFLAIALQPEEAMDCFTGLPQVSHVYARGPTKALVRLKQGIDADLRVVPPESFGAALLYFTGSKSHNIALRRIAQDRGLKLNEYGLFKGETSIAGRTEEEIYQALDLPFIPPEIREDNGEVAAAQHGKLPCLIEPDDLIGDLHMHTNWSDGAVSIEDMAVAAKSLGIRYIAITDHSRGLAMTNGLTDERVLEQLNEIARVNAGLSGIRVLSGVEVNIARDGSLDISDEILAKLDIVGAAVHSYFELKREEMTRRIIRAIENPNVDILVHPMGRNIGRRQAIDIDIEAVFQAAARTATILEIDSQPQRLDLPDELVRKAIACGIPISISSDAHHPGDLQFPKRFGVFVARRGWLDRDHVINTRPLNAMRAALKKPEARKRTGKRAVHV